MSKKMKSQCINIRVGRFLKDAQSGALLEPGREDDHRLFYGQHIEECQACRDALIDHANRTVAVPRLEDVAREKGIPFVELAHQLDEYRQELEQTALSQGMTLKKALKERLARAIAKVSTSANA